MSESVWMALLRNLSTNQYSGWFTFHNYNEPFADPLLFERIQEARHLVPSMRLAVYTNGDYRNNSQFSRAIQLGVNEIRVTLYPRSSEALDAPEWSAIERLFEEVAPGVNWLRQVTPIRLEGHIMLGGTKIIAIRPDVRHYSNRAGSVKGPKVQLRTRPCFMPNWSAAIDVDGNLKLCCQIFDVSGKDGHQYRFGNVGETPFFSLWYSSELMEARRRLANSRYSQLSACSACDHRMRPLDEEEAKHRLVELSRRSIQEPSHED